MSVRSFNVKITVILGNISYANTAIKMRRMMPRQSYDFSFDMLGESLLTSYFAQCFYAIRVNCVNRTV